MNIHDEEVVDTFLGEIREDPNLGPMVETIVRRTIEELRERFPGTKRTVVRQALIVDAQKELGHSHRRPPDPHHLFEVTE